MLSTIRSKDTCYFKMFYYGLDIKNHFVIFEVKDLIRRLLLKIMIITYHRMSNDVSQNMIRSINKLIVMDSG